MEYFCSAAAVGVEAIRQATMEATRQPPTYDQFVEFRRQTENKRQGCFKPKAGKRKHPQLVSVSLLSLCVKCLLISMLVLVALALVLVATSTSTSSTSTSTSTSTSASTSATSTSTSTILVALVYCGSKKRANFGGL